jgi:CheY-like chemotaxis protein
MAQILVVDDDAGVRATIAELLRDSGHDIREAADSIEAERVLNVFDADLVVTDIFMPNGDGLEGIRRLRAARPDMGIVAISGGGGGGFMEALRYARLLGADRTLAKPIPAEALEAAIDDLLHAAPPHAA